MASTPEDTPSDDHAIQGEWRVLRRIPPDGFKEDGRPKSSPNFDLDKNGRGTSVTLWLGDEDLENVLRGHDGFGVVWLPVREWRGHGLMIARKEVEGDPNHCEIWGHRSTAKKRKLAQAATWVVHPIGHPDKADG